VILKREPMSAVDTAWLRMESSTNLMMIGVVLVLEDPLDFLRFLALLEDRLLSFQRFRQKVVQDDGRYYWEDDPYFDIDNHVHRISLAGDGTQLELQKLAADLNSTPLCHDMPLWQVHLVDRYQGGSAIIARIHHCIADGLALVRVLLSLTDAPSTAPTSCGPLSEPRAKPYLNGHRNDLWQPARKLIRNTLQQGQELLEDSWDFIREPKQLVELARQGLVMSSELTRVGIMPPDPPTRLKGRLSGRKRVSWAEPLNLKEVKEMSRALDATINDVLLAAATGALRKYLVRHGDDITNEKIHVAVPFNLRPLNKPITTLGNEFGLVILPLPIGIHDPLERFEQVRDNMLALKKSYQAQTFYGLLGALGKGPHGLEKTALELLSRKASAVMTNVPGPTEHLYLAGSRLKQPMFWVPQSGDVGVGLSIFSYAGSVQFGLIADKNLIPYPDLLMKDFASSYREIEQLAMAYG